MSDALKRRFGERLKEDEPLAAHVNFRVGGPARFWLVAKSPDEIAGAARAAEEDGLKWVVIGGGSNVLPSDDGFDGLVIQAATRGWRIDHPGLDPGPREIGTGSRLDLRSSGMDSSGQGIRGDSGMDKELTTPDQRKTTPESRRDIRGQAEKQEPIVRVYAEAGIPSAFLARKTAEAGLTGFEWAVSLPGTIGGAVRGNAGCFGGEMKDVVETAEVLRIDTSIRRVRLTNEACRFGYRDSVFKHSADIVLSATLRLVQAPKEECLARIEKALAARKEEQPQGAACAGCMFKNFEFEDEAEIAKLTAQEDVPGAFLEARRLPAGWLIERAGFKGACVGKACVSEKHANFLVSDGATAGEIVQLISRIKTRIRDRYGIQLDEEVQYLGF